MQQEPHRLRQITTRFIARAARLRHFDAVPERRLTERELLAQGECRLARRQKKLRCLVGVGRHAGDSCDKQQLSGSRSLCLISDVIYCAILTGGGAGPVLG